MAKEVLLLSDVPGLGIEGDVVRVAEGHLRNYLLPKKLAAPVTAGTKRQIAKKLEVRTQRLAVKKKCRYVAPVGGRSTSSQAR